MSPTPADLEKAREWLTGGDMMVEFVDAFERYKPIPDSVIESLAAFRAEARREERERCADIARIRQNSGSWKNEDEDRGWNAACRSIAAALSQPAAPTPEEVMPHARSDANSAPAEYPGTHAVTGAAHPSHAGILCERYRQVVDAARKWREAECDCGGEGSHEESCPTLQSNVALVVAVDALDAAERPEAGKETG